MSVGSLAAEEMHSSEAVVVTFTSKTRTGSKFKHVCLMCKRCVLHSPEPGSVVGIATGYGMDGPGMESLWGRHFPWGPSSLLYNRYRVFHGGKERLGRDADPSPPSSAVIMEG
jgi:hypothetical protein